MLVPPFRNENTAPVKCAIGCSPVDMHLAVISRNGSTAKRIRYVARHHKPTGFAPGSGEEISRT